MPKCEDTGCPRVITIHGHMEWILVRARCSEHLEVEMCGLVADCLAIVSLAETFSKCASL